MNANQLRSIVQKYVCQEQITFPDCPSGFKQFVLVPVSSGIDSSAVLILMAALYPDMPLTAVFTDTGNEVSGTHEALDALERVTNRRIIRITPKHSLLDRTLASGNYLPSQRQRWCTQQMKTEPYRRFISGLRELHGDKTQFVSLVGVRADEGEREGVQWTESDIVTVFPLQQAGLTKADVNKLVDEVVGVPRYYANKSRSGCEICIFSRRSEIVAMMSRVNNSFDKAVKTEQLPIDYEASLISMPLSVCEMTKVARNWLLLARPDTLGGPAMGWSAVDGRKGSRTSQTLFGGAQLFYVAVEHHYNFVDFPGEKAIFMQKIVNYSTTFNGLVLSLKHHWLHRLHTKELWGHDSESDLQDEFRIGIYIVELHDVDMLIPPKPAGVYTWQTDGKTLLEIKKTVFLLEQVLLTEGLKQEARDADSRISQRGKKLLSRISREYGDVLQCVMYDAPTLESLIDDIDITEAPAACNACSR